MLILNRKSGESVTLDRHGETLGQITVIQLGDGRVRLGFEMDRHVAIIRDEIRGKYPPGTRHQR